MKTDVSVKALRGIERAVRFLLCDGFSPAEIRSIVNDQIKEELRVMNADAAQKGNDDGEGN